MSKDAGELRFDRFQLRRRQRMLLADGVPVVLSSRAIDVLLALIDAEGAPVSKDELMGRVWPGMIVDEHNLTVQIHTLRQAFGADRDLIRTVPRHGYCFTGQVVAAEAATPTRSAPALAPPVQNATNLPAAVEELIGRDAELTELVELIASRRLLTLTGPGGIGKTKLAIELARQMLPWFADGVWLVELAPLANPEQIQVTMLGALGLQLGAAVQSTERIAAALAGKTLLLVLDNCEHLIATAARAAEGLLRGGGGLHILATSREPLRADGEFVYRVPPLAVPGASVTDAKEILRHGAVRMFITRARSADAHFAAGNEQVAMINAICRRLDGIPLAIELAAPHAAALGVKEVLALLDDHLGLLFGGRRTALPRHQTLRATLDWSFDLLTELERVVLRCLAVFVGGFTARAASAVVSSAGATAAEVVECVANLVSKSLVAADVGGIKPRYRLLETTRAYALGKLAESGGENAIRERHAQYYRNLLEPTPSGMTETEFPGAYAVELDNVRAALTWAFSPAGDASLAVGLAAASVPLWLEMSLLSECRGWMEMALDRLDAGDRGERREMVLQCALGLSLIATQGMVDEARIALTRANELAESVQDAYYQLRALGGLRIFSLRSEDFGGAMVLGRRVEAIAGKTADPVALTIADDLLSKSLFYLGHYAEASRYAERVYRRGTPAVRRALMVVLGLDSSITAGVVQALVLWLQGSLDQSARMASAVLADAEASGNSVSLALALTWCGCLPSVARGDLEDAEKLIKQLKQHAARYGLGTYDAYRLSFEGQLSAMRGEVAIAEHLLRASLAALRQAQVQTLYTVFLGSLAELLAATGRPEEGIAAADEAVQRIERSGGLWWMPEALRIKGDALLQSDRSNMIAAEQQFDRSLDLARQQGALFWELRTATSLARLLRDRGRRTKARELLATVYGRFTEGFGAADLRGAKQLLDELCQIASKAAPLSECAPEGGQIENLGAPSSRI